jgi:hypothetical protein
MKNYLMNSNQELNAIFIRSPCGSDYNNRFYSLAVDKATLEVHVSGAIDYVQPGVVYRYLPGGIPLDTFQAGIAPGAFCIKP